MKSALFNFRFKDELYAVFFFVACAILIFGYKIAQGYVLAPEDDFVQNYPAFASGGTLWTPLLLTGFPLLADPQIQTFYPVAWLAKIMPLGAGLFANFNLYVASAYVLAALFAALLARRLTGSFYAGIFAGLVYAFSGYFVSELKHVQVLHTALWLPLLFYLIELARALIGQSRILQSLAICFALTLVLAITIFAGHPQTALYILTAAAVYAIVLLPPTKENCENKSPDNSLLFGFALLVALFSGLAIASVQLLPSIELSALSVRPTFTYRDFIVGQVEPMQVLGFCIPYVMGGLYGTIGSMPFSEQGPPPGLLFFGFAPLILAVYALFKNGKQRRVRYFALLALLTFILSLGDHTPLARLFYYLPFFGSVRGLYRVLILLVFAISILSAIGFARLENDYCGPEGNKKALQLAKTGAKKHLFICLYFALSCFSYTFLLGTFPLLLFVVRIQKLSFLYVQNSTKLQKILVGTAFAAMICYALNGEWTKQSHLRADFAPPALAAVYSAETGKSLSRIFSIKGIEADKNQLPPNLSRMWQVPSATGYEPLVPLRYARLMGISEGGFLEPPWHFNGANRAFDIVSVRYLFVPWGEFSDRAFDSQAAQNWKIAQAAEGTQIYENSRYRPRFYFVSECKYLPGEMIFETITTSKLPDGQSFDPAKTVLLEDPATISSLATKKSLSKSPPRSLSSSASGSSSSSSLSSASSSASSSPAKSPTVSSAQILSSTLQDERLVFKVKLTEPAYFVLADLFYPGWQAAIDGQNVTILRANYVQRALYVTSGEHQIDFTFKPDSLRTGIYISTATFAVWLLVFMTAFIFRRKNRP